MNEHGNGWGRFRYRFLWPVAPLVDEFSLYWGVGTVDGGILIKTWVIKNCVSRLLPLKYMAVKILNFISLRGDCTAHHDVTLLIDFLPGKYICCGDQGWGWGKVGVGVEGVGEWRRKKENGENSELDATLLLPEG